MGLRPNLPTGVRSGDMKLVTINIIDDDAPLPTVSLFISPGTTVTEGQDATVKAELSRIVRTNVSIPLTYAGDADGGNFNPAESNDYSGPSEVVIPSGRRVGSVIITIPEDGDADEWEAFRVSLTGLPDWLRSSGRSSRLVHIKDGNDGNQVRVVGQNSPGDNPPDSGSDGEAPPGGRYADLIQQVQQWRRDWDRALLAFGETVDDGTLTPMTAAEAQVLADSGMSRWAPVAAALRELENRAPAVSAAIADATIVHEAGRHEVSLAGGFSDADGDALYMAVTSSDDAVAGGFTLSGTLTILALTEGVATITVTAEDTDGNTVSDAFDVSVVAAVVTASEETQRAVPNRAPTVASAIADVTIVKESGTYQVSLSGVFSDADGDALIITVASSDEDVVAAFEFSGTLTIIGVAEGAETITVTAEDADGNTVSDAFGVHSPASHGSSS